MATTDIERLAHDLLEDIAARNLTEIIITSDGGIDSLSRLEFDELQARIIELAPSVKIIYRSIT